MNITFIVVGKLKEKYLKDAILEYKKRIQRFAKLEIIEIPDEKIPENASQKQEEQIKEKEGEKILSKLKDNSYFITLCIEGEELSSEEFADKIKNISMNNSNITFAIGGSLGLWDRVKSQSNLKLSFGRMTLPHQLMRVVLTEQLYRAFKINSNESYHK